MPVCLSPSKSGRKWASLAANGVGKTSLFKVICGDYTPDSGGGLSL